MQNVGYLFILRMKSLNLNVRQQIRNFILSKSMSKVCLDFEKGQFPLTIRRTKTGDRFIPYGMNGSKLVSDYLTDRKMSLFDKGRQLVIVDSFGTIIWLVNMRPDNKFCITTTSKKCINCNL